MTAAIAHGTAPFPVGQVHSSDFTALEALLGEEFQGTKGRVYRLAKADVAVASPATKIFKRKTSGSDTVNLTDDDATSYCCGVAVSDQVALAAGDYFFLQVSGKVTVTGKSGHGISAGDYIQPSGSGAEAGLVKTVGSTTALEPQLPLRAIAVDTNTITAYVDQKLLGN